MKTSISVMLLENAIEDVRAAVAAHAAGRPVDEVRRSISAQLMDALAIEGIGNEAGEAVFDAWTWERLERVDTPLKWRLIRSLHGPGPLDPGAEPLQTIQRLTAIRNRVAHPKIENLGTEVVIASSDGTVRRHVPPVTTCKDGDTIILGIGKLLDEGFNAKVSAALTRTSIAAIKEMRDSLKMRGLTWVEALETDLASIGDSA